MSMMLTTSVELQMRRMGSWLGIVRGSCSGNWLLYGMRRAHHRQQHHDTCHMECHSLPVNYTPTLWPSSSELSVFQDWELATRWLTVQYWSVISLLQLTTVHSLVWQYCLQRSTGQHKIKVIVNTRHTGLCWAPCQVVYSAIDCVVLQ